MAENYEKKIKIEPLPEPKPTPPPMEKAGKPAQSIARVKETHVMTPARREALKRARLAKAMKRERRKQDEIKRLEQEIKDKTIKPVAASPATPNPDLLKRIGVIENLLQNLNIKLESHQGTGTAPVKSRVEDRQSNIIKPKNSFERVRGAGIEEENLTRPDKVNTFHF
jgi:hypothetical protein